MKSAAYDIVGNMMDEKVFSKENQKGIRDAKIMKEIRESWFIDYSNDIVIR